MAGYRARTSGATEVRDELFARALVVDTEGGRFAVVSLDVMAVGHVWVAELRRRAADAVGIAPERLMVAATHTHAAQGGLIAFEGPAGSAFQALMGDGCGPYDEAGAEALLVQTLSCLQDAADRSRPARLQTAKGAVPGIAGNRVWEDRPVDDSCLTVSAIGEDGEVIAVLVHFNCHPTILGEAQTGISGDFAGEATRVIESALGGDAVALFLNGALGDISTRFTRRDQDYGEVQRLGRMLGDGVLELLEAATGIDDATPASAQTSVALEPLDGRWRESVERRVAELEAASDGSAGHARQLLTAREGAESAAKAASAIDALSAVPLELQVLWLGPQLGFCAVPGEPFSAMAATVAAAFDDADIRVVAPANGYHGYLPTREVYEAGGYEVGCSLVDRGATEQLADAAIELFATSRPLIKQGER
jgi:hypothetical protein